MSGVGTTGQILTSNGASALPTWQAAAASGIVTINGDTGSITGSTVTIHANNASQNCGSSVSFVNSATTSTLNITDGNSNVLLGSLSGNATLTGNSNAALGQSAGKALTSGSENSLIGRASGFNLTSGIYNSVLGYSGLNNLITGSYNTICGAQSGSNYSGSESSNIIIGYSVAGTAAESNVIRIGAQGSGVGQQNACYIAGIEGVTVSNLNIVTINTSTGQMGSETSVGTPNGGTGLTATPGNSSLLATNASGTLAYRALSINVQTFTSSGTYIQQQECFIALSNALEVEEVVVV